MGSQANRKRKSQGKWKVIWAGGKETKEGIKLLLNKQKVNKML